MSPREQIAEDVRLEAEAFAVLLVERLWPDATPRLELFARRRRPGWSSWGNEAPDCDLVFGSQIGNTWPVERLVAAASP